MNIRQLAVTLDKNASELSIDLQQTSAATRKALAEIEIAIKASGHNHEGSRGNHDQRAGRSSIRILLLRTSSQRACARFPGRRARCAC